VGVKLVEEMRLVALISACCGWVVEVGTYVRRIGLDVSGVASLLAGVDCWEDTTLFVLELGDRVLLADSTSQCLRAAS
jgi:hypothetical protein